MFLLCLYEAKTTPNMSFQGNEVTVEVFFMADVISSACKKYVIDKKLSIDFIVHRCLTYVRHNMTSELAA